MPSQQDANVDATLASLNLDPQELEGRVGSAGRALVAALNRAVTMQTDLIIRYVNSVRSRNPEATPAEVQKMMDSHFSRLAVGTGASVGVASAVPGIGFITGTAAVAGESVVFLDATAFYAMSSAYLRGIDIRDPERRRAIILLVLLGAKGISIIDVLVGDLENDPQGGIFSAAGALNRFSKPKLAAANNRLLRMAIRRATKKLLKGWIGKILPLGIGAVAGTLVNRKLAREIRENLHESLGPTPERFTTPAPDRADDADDEMDRIAAEAMENGHRDNSAGTDSK